VETKLKNQYGYAVHAKAKHAVADETGGKKAEITMGFAPMDEEEGGDAGRGGRGRGRGGRAGGDRVAKEGGRRQTARKALAKTEEDFPTL